MGIRNIGAKQKQVAVVTVEPGKEAKAYSYAKEVAADSLLALLFLVSIEEFICQIFKLSTHIEFLLPVGIIVIILLNLVWRTPKLCYLTIGILFIWMGILYLITRNDMINGLRILANDISDTLGAFYGRIFPKYDVYANAADYTVCITFFLLPIVIFLAIISVYLVHSRSGLLVGLLCIVALVLQAAMGGEASFLAFSVLLFAGLLLQIWNRTLYTVLITVGMAAVLFFGIAGGMKLSGRNELEVTAIVRNGMLQWIDDVRYHGATGDTFMTEGNFLLAGAVEVTGDAKALEVTMSKPESYYLRGYVGEVYTKSAWQQADSQELYAYRDLFYWLHKDGYYGQTQLASIANLVAGMSEADETDETDKSDEMDKTGETVEVDAQPIELQIHNIGASSKYEYTPYELLNYQNAMEKSYNRIGDSRNEVSGFFGTRDYTFLALSNQVSQYPSLVSNLAQAETDTSDAALQSYLTQESYYNNFVYSNYTQIPKTDANLLRNHLGAYKAVAGEHMPYEEAKKAILDYLLNHVSYSTTVDAMPVGRDFLQYFLEESGQGYSVHYATATVLMLRYYGIPARYVEGYLITPADVEGAQENVTLEITEDHAHAWAEYYQDGIGWIPFETTPAYINVMEQAKPLSSYASGDSSSETTEESYEMTQDNYEASEDETMDNRNMHLLVVVITIGFVLLLVLSYILLICYRRRKWRRLLLQADCRKAVIAVKAYEQALYHLGVDLEKGKEHELLQRLYEEARYSNHRIGEEEKLQALECIHIIRDSVRKESSLILRMKCYLAGL